MESYVMALEAVRERVQCYADTSTPHLFVLISLLQDAGQDVSVLQAQVELLARSVF